MNPADVETRLRAMYVAKGDAITDATLTQRTPPSDGVLVTGTSPARRHIRWLAPLVAAAAVVALAVSVVATKHTTRPKPTPTQPAITRSVAPLPTTPGKVLKRGEVGQRTDVPWRSVGRGWTVALWGATKNPATLTVFLVNPVGGRYTITTIP